MQVFKLKKFDLDDVNRLIEIAKKNDLSVLEIEAKKGRRIRIETKPTGNTEVTYPAGMQSQQTTQPMYVPPLPSVQPVMQVVEPMQVQQPVEQMKTAPIISKPEPAPVKEEVTESPANTIDAPMVGVFYRAPSPDADPYVKAGSRISKGDIICIIEAMKLMNEIKAEEDGVIEKVLVKNGEIVEFGQPMFELK